MCLEIRSTCSAITALFHWPTQLLRPFHLLTPSLKKKVKQHRPAVSSCVIPLWVFSLLNGPGLCLSHPERIRALLNESFGPVYLENHPLGVHLKEFYFSVGRCCREVWRELLSGNHIICFTQQPSSWHGLCQELSGFWFTFPPLFSNRRPVHLFRPCSRG